MLQHLTERDQIKLFLQQEIANEPVLLYTKTTCEFCKAAEKLLEEASISYKNYDIDVYRNGVEV